MFTNCGHVFNRCAFSFGKKMENRKCSSGDVERSFDNFAEVVAKSQKQFVHSPKTKFLELIF